MNIQKIFGENLRRARIKSGLSQSKLANKSGFSPAYVNRIEKGEENISLKNIWMISNVLNVPIKTLFSPFQDSQYKAIVFDFHFKMLKKLGLKDQVIAKAINKDISRQFFGNPKIHRMYDDAKKILPFLKKHKGKLVLLTNGYKSTVKAVEYFGLNKYFDHVLVSCDVGISKPDPRLYRIIAKKLSVKCEEILCVGDSYATDVVGAIKSGCGAAIIDRKNTEDKKKYDCVYLNNLTQIKNLI